MDNKFKRPDKSRLTNAQYFSFMTAFVELLDTAAFTANAVVARKTALEQQVAQVDKYLKIQQGSYLSQQIYDADHRGDLAYGTAHAIVLAWLGKEFQPQAEAAEMLNRVFKLYKIDTGAQYDEQWGLVGNFLTDIQKPEMAAHIATLGIGQPLQVLAESYTQMKALIRQRDDETNGKAKGALAQARKDCDQAYNQMLDIIEAAALMADNATPYYEFITRWNTALTRYSQQIIDKKGTGTGTSTGTGTGTGTGTSTGTGTGTGTNPNPNDNSGNPSDSSDSGNSGSGDNPSAPSDPGTGDNPGTSDNPGTGDNPGDGFVDGAYEG